ncbi:MAG: ABC transporter permease [Acidimicrobiia bacterium]
MSAADPVPHIVIKPPSRWAPLNLREVWEFRDLLTRFAIRDLKLRYKQTALGVIWVVLQPLLAAGIFSFVFGRVADLPSEGVPYFVFAYVGMMAWTAFSSTLSKISSSLVGNAQLISKIFFPRLVLPLSTLGSTLVDFAVALAMGAVVIAAGGVAPGLAVLTMPLWFVLALLLGTGLGLVAAALMVQYRDIGYVLPVVTQMLLYGTPIAYAMSAVPQSAKWVVQLNPLAGVIEGFRWSLLDTPAPTGGVIIWSAVASITLFLAGSLVFTRMERRFADVI